MRMLDKQYEFLKPLLYRRTQYGISGPQYAGMTEALEEAGYVMGTPEWWEAHSEVQTFLALRRAERPHAWVQALAGEHPDLNGYVDVTWLTPVTGGHKRNPISNTAFRVKDGKARSLRKGENPGVLLALVDWRPVQRGRADEPAIVWVVRGAVSGVECQASSVRGEVSSQAFRPAAWPLALMSEEAMQ